MAKTIIGNQDSTTGANDSYTIPGRGSNIPRKTIIEIRKSGDTILKSAPIQGMELV